MLHNQQAGVSEQERQWLCGGKTSYGKLQKVPKRLENRASAGFNEEP
jgi:hypothetical protein